VQCKHGRHTTNQHARLISAAQLFTHLLANCKHRKPDHASQLRPLIGLFPQHAQQAWEYAAEKAGGRKITAHLVKTAGQELQLAGETTPATRQPRQTKTQQRQLLDSAIGELLVLLSQKAIHDVLTQKVESLHGQIQALFPKPSSKK
jgi:hypothetical protein